MRVAEVTSPSGFSAKDLERLDAIYEGDPVAYIEDQLVIRPAEGGETVPLRLNRGQRKLLEVIWRQWTTKKRVRIIILKARQIGFSTGIQAFDTWFTTRRHQVASLIIAHERDGSKNLFEMFTRYLDNLLPEFRPMVRSRNEAQGRLEFDNPDPRQRSQVPGLGSSLKTETAEDKEAGRSGTYQFVHASEVAFWPYPQTFTALKSTVHDLPGTVFIIESTANGTGGDFHDEWTMAVRGESDFEPVFIAWWEHDEYRRPTVPREDAVWARIRSAIDAGEQPDPRDLDELKLNQTEVELAKLYPLDYGQIKWRRWAIVDKCQNDEDRFKQEYPSCADEAFLVSGRPWFNIANVVRRKELARRAPPAARFTIDVPACRAQGRPVLVPDPFGEVWVWESPVAGQVYVIGADVAEGGEGGDADAADVLELRTGRQVAELHGRFDTDLYGWKLHFLGLWYNTALLGPERNSMGVAVCNTLEHYSGYPNLYTEFTPGGQVKEYGWRTTPATRPVIVSRLKEWVREDILDSPSVAFWEECLTFKVDKNGKPQAEGRKHDDRVLAKAIALEMREYLLALGQVPGPLAAVGTASYQDLLATGMPVLAADDEIDPAVLRTMPPWLRPGG